jgi:hypothetical protein
MVIQGIPYQQKLKHIHKHNQINHNMEMLKVRNVELIYLLIDLFIFLLNGANRFSTSQEIPHILRKPEVHYRIYKRPPPVPILSHLANRGKNSSRNIGMSCALAMLVCWTPAPSESMSRQTDTCAIWWDILDNTRFFPLVCGITCYRMLTLASDGNLCWSYMLMIPLELSSGQAITVS